MTRRPIRVRIDRLVLEGVAPHDRAAVARAFERELARGLRGVAPAARSGGELSLTAHGGRDAAGAGRAAAAVLAARLGRGGRP